MHVLSVCVHTINMSECAVALQYGDVTIHARHQVAGKGGHDEGPHVFIMLLPQNLFLDLNHSMGPFRKWVSYSQRC